MNFENGYQSTMGYSTIALTKGVYVTVKAGNQGLLAFKLHSQCPNYNSQLTWQLHPKDFGKRTFTKLKINVAISCKSNAPSIRQQHKQLQDGYSSRFSLEDWSSRLQFAPRHNLTFNRFLQVC